MMNQNPILAPLLNTEAGLCLTAQNWRDAGINWLVCDLQALLHKPGLALLKQLKSLASYLGWGGKVILTAAHLKANREGIYKIKSPYDGSILTFDDGELKHLLEKLQPDVVVLPANITKNDSTIWNSWNDAIFPFVHFQDSDEIQPSCDFGVYCSAVDYYAHSLKTGPIYITEVHCREQMLNLFYDKGVQFIESNQPGQDALCGILYNEEGVINITNSEHEFNYQPIAKNCQCETCSARFTPAYLHHLYVHTPLLCQRLLIQHNLSWVANYLKGDKLKA
ncbi:MAG: hypothetical protein BGO90_09675 [Legionella sp. 40-6]|nr:tRNA-guanine transglycosylase [Legionella sp.]OJY17305.1 MAG: hypothetical protein BGO90_09675 [Legionella sp. 40-6]